MVQRFSILLSLFLIASVKGFAQGIPSDASARSLALSQSEIADPQDEWTPNAAMRLDTNAHVRTVLAPDPLNLPGSYTVGFSADAPLDNGLTIGAGFIRFDNSQIGFSSQSLSAQASKTFPVSGVGTSARFASAGIRIRYGEVTFSPIYLPYEDVTADLGATFDLFPQLTAGVAVTHLFSLFNNQGDSIESRAAWIGLTYRPTLDLAIHGALETSGGENIPAFHGGIEYAFDRHLLLRLGAVSASPSTGNKGEISGGFGVRTSSLMADFSAVRHPDLGTFISFGIGFNL